jgi:hypothetical protein
MYTSHLFNDVLSCSLVVMMKAARRHVKLISVCNKQRHDFGSVWQCVEYSCWKHGTPYDYGNTELYAKCVFHLIFRWEQ